MSRRSAAPEASLPAVDRVLRTPELRHLAQVHGRAAAREAVRDTLAEHRRTLRQGRTPRCAEETLDAVVACVAARLGDRTRASLVPVFNLTGTLIHTNLGRAPLPAEAIEAITAIAGGASNLEYDLGRGTRGDRDAHVAGLLSELTGAQSATVVNNNAAALLLALNTLARNREVVVSRGELVEIGDSFRLPEIMARAGCRVREVGTTNRTRLADYAEATGARTAAFLKVHMSNYRIEGFVGAASVRELARLARERGLPLVVDLGSGALVGLERYGLPHEPTVRETLRDGADLVTFSGDKLLGGPQAGILAGSGELIARAKRNPLRRALRPGKLTLAALAALLRLYRDPERLEARLPALALMLRPLDEIERMAERLAPLLAERLAGVAEVAVKATQCQIGSGALPLEGIPSVALALGPLGGKRGRGARLERLARAFRALPKPVVGRSHEGALLLDLRALDDEAGFVAQLDALANALERGA